MPFVEIKEFYTPKYRIKDKPSPLPDLRSTVYWAPDVITDASGKATVSFYSADRAGNYTVTTEGSDMDGHIGSKTSHVKIEKK
jgi:uncharacterized protein YfaS (alpha-2-macroglobulin family)